MACLLLGSEVLAAGKAENKPGSSDDSWVDPTAEQVDMRKFLSDGPPRREVVPDRGHLLLAGDAMDLLEMAHWEERAGNVQASRWGRYDVCLRYTLRKAGLGLQCQLAGEKMKGLLSGRETSKMMGTVYLSKPGVVPVRILTPPVEDETTFTLHEVRLIPACEGKSPEVEADGSFILHARDATTWSNTLRYEPDKAKNCLGFWTDIEDFAEWEIVTSVPATFAATIIYGCGDKNAGSVVALRSGETEIVFTVEATGGFQSWKKLEIGAIQFPEAGRHQVVVQPKIKEGSAVMDLKQLVLTPVD